MSADLFFLPSKMLLKRRLNEITKMDDFIKILVLVNKADFGWQGCGRKRRGG